MAEQDATEDAAKDVAEDAAEDVAEDVAELDATEPQSELPEPAPVLDDEFVETPLEESSEEEPPPPKRVRKARVQPPKAKAEPKTKAEPKRRGRPPGARNVVRAPAAVQQDPMEIIMNSMRERRQAHQERQHTFFQAFLPA